VLGGGEGDQCVVGGSGGGLPGGDRGEEFLVAVLGQGEEGARGCALTGPSRPRGPPCWPPADLACSLLGVGCPAIGSTVAPTRKALQEESLISGGRRSVIASRMGDQVPRAGPVRCPSPLAADAISGEGAVAASLTTFLARVTC
jgi:hypothetical protein